ncbi:hypothetical protein Tco_0985823 [Tanacetum coccineum]
MVLNKLSLNDLRSSIRLHDWYQSLMALDLGSTRRMLIYDGYLKKGILKQWLQVSTARVDVSTAKVKHYTASLIFEGRLVLPVHVNAAITKVTTVGLKPSGAVARFGGEQEQVPKSVDDEKQQVPAMMREGVVSGDGDWRKGERWRK